MKKNFWAVSLFALAAAFLFSCGGEKSGASGAGENAENGNPASPEESVEGEILPDYVPDGVDERDLGGYEFRILTRSTCVHPLYIDAESIDGELINDAIYNRNRAAEERFNIAIRPIIVHEGEPQTDNANSTPLVKKSIMAGEDFADIAMLHMIDAGALAAQGMFIDWQLVPGIDLSKPWWDKNVVEGLSIGGKLYLNTGHFNLESYDYTWGMVFNKQLWQDKNLPDIYGTVKEGKWTLDYFNSIIKNATSDLNGDGQYTADDQWGFIAIDRGGLTNFMFGSDQRVFVRNGGGAFDLVLNTDRMQAIVELTYEIYYQNNSTYIWESAVGYFPETQPLGMFADGKGLLASARLAGIPILRGMDADFGIIPQPKFDESQIEYTSFSDGHTSMMAIPKTVSDFGLNTVIGALAEALSAANYNTVMKSYYDINLQTKFTRDEESADMMDIIIKNRIFDIGYVYANVTGNLGFMINDLINQKKTAFASEFEKREASALRALAKLVEEFESIGEG
ncbi:MAG: hypothetical protein FWG34_05660 [Oscillospiraceae bacterium]|nr:hypothetical protein [Oscillospiraceae bacterium]